MIKHFVSLLNLLWQDFIFLIYKFVRSPKKGAAGAYAKKLRKDGYITIPNYISSEEANRLKEKLLSIVEKLPNGGSLETGGTVEIRGGADSGMVDIFHIEYEDQALEKIRFDGFLLDILRMATHQKVYATRMNAYINKSITKTRGFHVDNAHPESYKGFVYLTDVNSEEDGPYAYVKGSHFTSIHKYISWIKAIFSKEKHFGTIRSYNPKKVVPMIAPKGTLILSSQNGIHRGLPQKEGHVRILLSNLYHVVSPLTYLNQQAKKLVVDAKKYKQNEQ